MIQVILSQGHTCVIDDIDNDLALLKWSSKISLSGHVIAYRQQRINKIDMRIRMHRIIFERMIGRKLEKHEEVDHIDCNPLNNQRSNLRLANRNEQMHNLRKPCTNTSGYKGVTWDKKRQRWMSKIWQNNKSYFLGYFDDPKEAHQRYCNEAVKRFGEFARFE